MLSIACRALLVSCLLSHVSCLVSLCPKRYTLVASGQLLVAIPHLIDRARQSCYSPKWNFNQESEMNMRVIGYKSSELGEFQWRLPETTEEVFSALPDDIQKSFITIATGLWTTHCGVLASLLNDLPESADLLSVFYRKYADLVEETAQNLENLEEL